MNCRKMLSGGKPKELHRPSVRTATASQNLDKGTRGVTRCGLKLNGLIVEGSIGGMDSTHVWKVHWTRHPLPVLTEAECKWIGPAGYTRPESRNCAWHPPHVLAKPKRMDWPK